MPKAYLQNLCQTKILDAGMLKSLLYMATRSNRYVNDLFIGNIEVHTINQTVMYRVPIGVPQPDAVIATKEHYQFCGFHATCMDAMCQIVKCGRIKGTDYGADYPGSVEVTFWRAAVNNNNFEELLEETKKTCPLRRHPLTASPAWCSRERGPLRLRI